LVLRLERNRTKDRKVASVSTDDEQQVSPAFPQRLSADDAYSVARGSWPLEAVRSSRVELSGTLDAGSDARRALELHLVDLG
jgi:hypothetical protein